MVFIEFMGRYIVCMVEIAVLYGGDCGQALDQGYALVKVG